MKNKKPNRITTFVDDATLGVIDKGRKKYHIYDYESGVYHVRKISRSKRVSGLSKTRIGSHSIKADYWT